MRINSASNLALLLINQFVTRGITFILNLLTVRHVGAIAFGIASIHLYLIYTTILFLAREPFRRATLQVGFKPLSHLTNDPKVRKFGYQLSLLATLRTVIYTILPLGAIISIVLSYIYIINPPDFGTTTTQNNILPIIQDLSALSQWRDFISVLLKSAISLQFNTLSTQDCYLIGVLSFSISALIELSSEHLYLHTTRLGNTSTRVGIETFANISRCVLTYFPVLGLQLLQQLNTGTAILAYSIGQVVFSCSITVGYFGYYWYHISKGSTHLFISNDVLTTAQKDQEEQRNDSSSPSTDQNNGKKISTKKLNKSGDEDELTTTKRHTGTATLPTPAAKTELIESTESIHPLNHQCLLFSSPTQLLPFLPQYNSIMNDSPKNNNNKIGEPNTNSAIHIFDHELFSWFKAFGLQSAFKHLLTEGEKMVLVTLSPFSPEQNGAYALVTNLGGLFVRLVLQPLEENSQQLFSAFHRDVQFRTEKLEEILNNQSSGPMTETNSSSTCTSTTLILDNYTQLCEAKGQLKSKLQKSFLLSAYIGSILAIFGPPMAFTAIRLLYGHHWAEETTAPAILAMYAVAQLFFSLNGIAEGFLFSTIRSTTALYHANMTLVLFSFIYLGVIVVFSKVNDLLTVFGTQGLIIANMIGMILRIIHSFVHIRAYFLPSAVELKIQDEFIIDYENEEITRDNQPQGKTKEKKLIGNPKGFVHDDDISSDDDGHDDDDDDDDTLPPTQTLHQPPQPSSTTSFSTILSWCFPSILPRWWLFLSFLYSHFIVTWFLFPSIAGFDDIILNVFKLIIKSKQSFATDAVPFQEPRKIEHTGPEYIQRYLAPPLTRHFWAIGCILPVLLILIVLIIKFDRSRISQR